MSELALLADIGGTQTRVALATDGQIVEGSNRILANNDHASFPAMLDHVLATTGPVDAISIAAAGPLRGGSIRMTNRDWVIETAALRALAPRVHLMNDMTAHALSVPLLAKDRCIVLHAGSGAGNGQWAVANLGTGYNSSVALRHGGGIVAPAAETGMCPVSDPIAERLRAAGAEVPTMTDHLFSGPGFARLREALGEAADPLFGACLAMQLRDLINGALPLDGVYLCGGLGQAMATIPARETLLEGLAQPYDKLPFLGDVPVYAITGDDTALLGCLAALSPVAPE